MLRVGEIATWMLIRDMFAAMLRRGVADGSWCFVGEVQAFSVVASASHSGSEGDDLMTGMQGVP